MKKRESKYELLFQEVERNLPSSFRKHILSSQVKNVLEKDIHKNKESKDDWKSLKKTLDEESIAQNKEASLRRLITKRLSEVKYKTHGNISPPKIYTFEKNSDDLDLACGFISHNQYFSNLSAIYFLGLTDQKIQTHYICKETHYLSNRESVYDENLAKLTFRKNARRSNRYVQYEGTRIYFLEKQDLNMLGVIDLPFKKKNKNLFYIKCTNLERTFMDSIVTPQYSGGLDSIISFFKNKSLNLTDLKKIYQTLCPVYPYWQKIGFLLELMGQKEKSRTWGKLFENLPLKKFFLDRGYRNDWAFNKKWQIYYPKKIM
ncbi:MAG: hypothetical protein OXB88_02075 [Bacteriovoracales bacterium]|nr:hypothetical protein [Bacteriovoracales bacterium]